jgi:hypothetical protein
LSDGYDSIKDFFQVNEKMIKEFPDKCGIDIKCKLIKNNYLDAVIRVINIPEFDETLDLFDIGACSSIIQNMFASNSKYLSYFKKDPNKCKLSFDKKSQFR